VTRSERKFLSHATTSFTVSIFMTGDPSSELQQYLHLEGHPNVGMSMMWKGFFMILLCFSCEGKMVTKPRPGPVFFSCKLCVLGWFIFHVGSILLGELSLTDVTLRSPDPGSGPPGISLGNLKPEKQPP